jgi:hypothetical protein
MTSTVTAHWHSTILGPRPHSFVTRPRDSESEPESRPPHTVTGCGTARRRRPRPGHESLASRRTVTPAVTGGPVPVAARRRSPSARMVRDGDGTTSIRDYVTRGQATEPRTTQSRSRPAGGRALCPGQLIGAAIPFKFQVRSSPSRPVPCSPGHEFSGPRSRPGAEVRVSGRCPPVTAPARLPS